MAIEQHELNLNYQRLKQPVRLTEAPTIVIAGQQGMGGMNMGAAMMGGAMMLGALGRGIAKFNVARIIAKQSRLPKMRPDQFVRYGQKTYQQELEGRVAAMENRVAREQLRGNVWKGSVQRRIDRLASRPKMVPDERIEIGVGPIREAAQAAIKIQPQTLDPHAMQRRLDVLTQEYMSRGLRMDVKDALFRIKRQAVEVQHMKPMPELDDIPNLIPGAEIILKTTRGDFL